MDNYVVTGTLEYYKLCSCDDCHGHEHHKSVSLEIEAGSPDEAKELALVELSDRYNQSDWYDACWSGKTTVWLASNEEYYMHKHKEPMLFDLSGIGLAKNL
jgi:hypothetical protein